MAEKKENAAELQQKYMEMQMIEQQIVNLQKQLQMIEKQFIELNVVSESLTEIGNIKINTEILVPVSSGIFVKAEIKDNKILKVNVGNGVVTDKSIDETKLLIDKQFEELKLVKEQFITQISVFENQALQVEQDLKSMISEE